MLRNRFVAQIVVMLAYTLVLAAFTWPLLSRLATHLAGTPGDNQIFYWNIWWFRTALFEHHVWPFHTHYLFFPVGTTLAFHTTTLLNTIPGAIAALFLSLPVVYNLLIFANFVLAAFFMHLLALEVLERSSTARHLAGGGSWRVISGAAFAGLAYSVSPFHVAHLGHLNIFTLWPVPFLVWRVLLFCDRASLPNAMWAGAALGLCGLADPYHLLTAIILAPLVWLLFRPRPGTSPSPTSSLHPVPDNHPSSRSHWRPMAMMPAVFLLVLTPVWLPVLQVGRDGLEMVQATGSVEFVALMCRSWRTQPCCDDILHHQSSETGNRGLEARLLPDQALPR